MMKTLQINGSSSFAAKFAIGLSLLLFGLPSISGAKIDTNQLISSSIWNSSGQAVSLGAIKGRKIVLNFYASWCGACINEVRVLNGIKNSSAGMYDVISISIDDDIGKARSFASKTGMAYHNLVGGGIAKSIMASLGNNQGAVPFTLVIEKSGEISFSKIGEAKEVDISRYLSN